MLLVLGIVVVLALVGAGAMALRARQVRPVDPPTVKVTETLQTPQPVRRGAQSASEGLRSSVTPPPQRPLAKPVAEAAIKAEPAAAKDPRAPRPITSRAALPPSGSAPSAAKERPATVGRPALPVAQIRPRPALPTSRRDARQTILIVDDSLVMQRSLANLFNGAGYSTAVAEHGEAALDWVTANGMPGLITLDMEMPGRNGVETLRDLFALGGSQPVPAIFITTRQPSGLREATSPMGVLGYFSKPFIPEDLLIVARQTVPHVAQAAL